MMRPGPSNRVQIDEDHGRRVPPSRAGSIASPGTSQDTSPSFSPRPSSDVLPPHLSIRTSSSGNDSSIQSSPSALQWSPTTIAVPALHPQSPKATKPSPIPRRRARSQADASIPDIIPEPGQGRPPRQGTPPPRHDWPTENRAAEHFFTEIRNKFNGGANHRKEPLSRRIQEEIERELEHHVMIGD